MTTLGKEERLADLTQVMDAIGVGVLVWNVDRTLWHANARAVELAGRPLPPGLTCAALVATLRLCDAEDGTPYSAERLLPAGVFEGEVAPLEVAALARPDGRDCRVEGTTRVVRTHDGTTLYAVTTFSDVTERQRAEALAAGEARVLAMVAEEAPLSDTLETLTRVFEAHAEGMLASVLLVEDGNVRHAAATSLPPAWAELVDGQPIGPNRGSCGTAAYLKQVVVVSDIANDPRWEPYREAALGFGLRASWSTPILDHDRQVLGTFAFYYTSPREPTEALLALADRASRLASVAIQRHRQRAERQRMENELRELREREQLHAVLDVAPSAVAITRDGKVCYANAKFVELFGFGVGGDARARIVDAPVRERIMADLAAGRARYDLEVRAEDKDGRVVDLLSAYRPIEYEHRPSLLIYIVDVSRLKEAQRAANAAMRAKSLFLASMSHEIRTPLNAILGYAQLLEREQSLSAEQHRSVEAIHSAGRHLLTLMNAIIGLATREESRTTVAEDPFDPGLASLVAPSPPEAQARSARLASLVSSLPLPLVEELRAAALEARAGRITHLAEQARPYSEVAAREIEELAEGFRYDALLSALEGGEA